ncbi:hypothetical protein GTR02_01175 [Kineococcus sp. R8]|uniref:hypothetical protein n=1 Tax=Kineococcus siccus TaxID=2696567 RepID=UPI001412C9F8|nr:hypothetical protein [Kineococcus siccus]NAZ80430.1 hypothetical protein [Kineococcus siccus]
MPPPARIGAILCFAAFVVLLVTDTSSVLAWVAFGIGFILLAVGRRRHAVTNGRSRNRPRNRV